MFNDDFYPSNDKAIEVLLSPFMRETRWGSLLALKGMTVLEPSAGSGVLVDELIQRDVPADSIYCIENDPNLRLILQGKKYKLIHDDFETFAPNGYRFNAIIMNPPFKTGVWHVIRAWDVVADGGVVSCLLNAETLQNPFTASRKAVTQLIELFGEWRNVGAIFSTADRKTAVDVAHIVLRKPERKAEDIDINLPGRDEPFEGSGFEANPLALASVVDSLVAQYNAAVLLAVKVHKAQDRLNFYTRQVMRVTPLTDRDLNERLDEIKGSFWGYVFEKTQIGKGMTSQYQERIRDYLLVTKNVAFTMENIVAMVGEFYENRGSLMQQCLLATFDTATAYHKDNIVHHEGWKTNKSYRIAPKVIVPDGVTFDSRFDSWSENHRKYDFLMDLDRVLAYLDGQRYDTVDMSAYNALRERCTQLNRLRGAGTRYSDTFDSTYFKIRMFKKGTVHLTFLREDLLEQFNRQAAIGKKWVGGGY